MQVGERPSLASGDVERLVLDRGQQGLHHPVRDVLHIREVEPRVVRLHDRQRPSPERALEEALHDPVVHVGRTVDGRRPDDDVGKAAGARERLDQDLAGELEATVEILGGRARVLRHRRLREVAVDHARRHVEKLLQPVVEREFDEVERAAKNAVERVIRAHPRDGRERQRAEVEQILRLRVEEDATHLVAVLRRRDDDMGMLEEHLAPVPQAVPVARLERVGVRQERIDDHYLVTVRSEGRTHVGPDETGAPGDEHDAHSRASLSRGTGITCSHGRRRLPAPARTATGPGAQGWRARRVQ